MHQGVTRIESGAFMVFLSFNHRSEVVSKPQIVFEDKASIRFKSGAYTQYVSILNRIATQPSDTRWDFETTSGIYLPICSTTFKTPG